MDILLKLAFYGLLCTGLSLIGLVSVLILGQTRVPDGSELAAHLVSSMVALGLMWWAGYAGHMEGHLVQGILTAVLAVIVFIGMTVGGFLLFGHLGHH